MRHDRKRTKAWGFAMDPRSVLVLRTSHSEGGASHIGGPSDAFVGEGDARGGFEVAFEAASALGVLEGGVELQGSRAEGWRVITAAVVVVQKALAQIRGKTGVVAFRESLAA
ncbi:MAG: hypothetical protein RI897_2278, partial [Verrucomicrobiota bacterium]